MNFAILNNQLIDQDNIKLSSKNRGFLYGDGFFESIKVFNKKPFNFENHYLRIKFSANYLGLDFNHSKNDFLEMISLLINKNEIINCSIRITIFRSSLGKYYPKEDSSSCYITAAKDDNSFFLHSKEELRIGVYEENLKSTSAISNLKTLNSLFYVLASKYSRDNNFNDVFLLNTNKNIIESTNSNFFIIKSGMVFTPPISDGCVDGSMRKLLISIIKNKYDFSTQSLSYKQIQDSEEIILSNAISGVRRVTFFGNKNYMKQDFYNFLIESLNKLI